MSVNCLDRECHFEERMVSNCLFYDINSSANCSIPCRLEYCTYTIINDVLCPIWHCTPWTTTTTSSPITTTLNPSPKPNYSPENLFSYCLNLLLFLVLSTITVMYFLRRHRRTIDLRDEELQRLMNPIVRYSIDSDPDSITVEGNQTSRISLVNTSACIKNKKNPAKVKIRSKLLAPNQEKFRVVFHKFLNENFEISSDVEFLTQPDSTELEWFHELPQVEIQRLSNN